MTPNQVAVESVRIGPSYQLVYLSLLMLHVQPELPCVTSCINHWLFMLHQGRQPMARAPNVAREAIFSGPRARSVIFHNSPMVEDLSNYI